MASEEMYLYNNSDFNEVIIFYGLEAISFRDRKKVKKLLYYISELSPKHLMKQKMDAYLFYVCVRQ